MRRTAVTAPLLAAALAPLLAGAASACASRGATPHTAPRTTRPAASAPAPDATGPYTVGVVDTDTQGRVFTDAEFRVLYRDVADNPAKRSFDCVTHCLKLYHPLLTHPGATLRLPPGVSGTLSFAVRPDGVGDQVTVDGYAVYTFSGDQPGTTGGRGATWRTVAAPVQPSPPSPANRR